MELLKQNNFWLQNMTTTIMSILLKIDFKIRVNIVIFIYLLLYNRSTYNNRSYLISAEQAHTRSREIKTCIPDVYYRKCIVVWKCTWTFNKLTKWTYHLTVVARMINNVSNYGTSRKKHRYMYEEMVSKFNKQTILHCADDWWVT